MVVDACSFRTSGIGDLETIFHKSIHDVSTLVALEAELNRRKTPRARELRGKVQQQLLALNGAASARDAKPWYRRGGVLLSTGAVVVAGIAQGIFHAVGFHMWEPIWRKVQELSALW